MGKCLQTATRMVVAADHVAMGSLAKNEGKCRDGCANNDHCLAYYYMNQTKLYGANALGACVWAFDTPENCKAVSAPNPFSSGGHQAYGNWAAMTERSCECLGTRPVGLALGLLQMT